jgi:hypothetical protein
MRVTVSHTQPKQEVKNRINAGLDDVFRMAGSGVVQIANEQRSWSGDQLNFSFDARMGIMNLPVKGFVLVEDRQVTVDIDLPQFISNLIPEAKMKQGLENGVKGLLT